MDPFLTTFLNIASDFGVVVLVLGFFAIVGTIIWFLIQTLRHP